MVLYAVDLTIKDCVRPDTSARLAPTLHFMRDMRSIVTRLFKTVRQAVIYDILPWIAIAVVSVAPRYPNNKYGD